MSTKQKHQRTKGNVKPSSSAKAAELLAASGHTGSTTIGFLGFEAFSASLSTGKSVDDEGVVNENAELDADVRVAMRQLFKKEAVTKVKALKVLEGLFGEKEESSLLVVIQCWPRLYNKLAVDNDYKVREAAHSALRTLASRLQKQMGPYLRNFGAAWLLGLHDPYPAVAGVARDAFENCFAEEKRSGVYGFCAEEILKLCANILVKQVPVPNKSCDSEEAHEERERHARLSLCALQLLRTTLDCAPRKTLLSQEFGRVLFDDVVDQSKIWKLYPVAGNFNVRAAFFDFVRALVDKMTPYFSSKSEADDELNIPEQKRSDHGDGSESKSVSNKENATAIEERMKKCAGAAVTVLNNPKPVVLKPGISLLITLAKFDNFWSSVSMEKVFLPGLCKLLDSGCSGCAYLVGPSLLVLLSRMPPDVDSCAMAKASSSHPIGVQVVGCPVGFGKIMKSLTAGCQTLLNSPRSPMSESCAMLQSFCDCVRLAVARLAGVGDEMKRDLVESTKSLLDLALNLSAGRIKHTMKIMCELVVVVLKSNDKVLIDGISAFLGEEPKFYNSKFESLVELLGLIDLSYSENISKNSSDYGDKSVIKSIICKSIEKSVDKFCNKILDESLSKEDFAASLFCDNGTLYHALKLLTIWGRFFPKQFVSTLKCLDSSNSGVFNKSLIKFVVTKKPGENDCSYEVLKNVIRLLIIEGLELSAQRGHLHDSLLDLLRIDNNFIPTGFQFVALCEELQICANFFDYWATFYRELLKSTEFDFLIKSGFDNFVTVEIKSNQPFNDQLCDRFLNCLKKKDPIASFQLSPEVTSDFCDNLYQLFPTFSEFVTPGTSTSGDKVAETIPNPRFTISKRFLKILVVFAEVVFDLSGTPAQYLLRRRLLSAMLDVHFVCGSLGREAFELRNSVHSTWLEMFKRSSIVSVETGNTIENVIYTMNDVGESFRKHLVEDAGVGDDNFCETFSSGELNALTVGTAGKNYDIKTDKFADKPEGFLGYWLNCLDSALQVASSLDLKDSVCRLKSFLIAVCPKFLDNFAVGLTDNKFFRILLGHLIQDHKLPGFHDFWFENPGEALNPIDGERGTGDFKEIKIIMNGMARKGILMAFLLPKFCESSMIFEFESFNEADMGDTEFITRITTHLHLANGIAKVIGFMQRSHSINYLKTSKFDFLIGNCNNALEGFYNSASDPQKLYLLNAICDDALNLGSLWILAQDDLLGYFSNLQSSDTMLNNLKSVFQKALAKLRKIFFGDEICCDDYLNKVETCMRVLFVCHLHLPNGTLEMEPVMELVEQKLKNEIVGTDGDPFAKKSCLIGGLTFFACVHGLSREYCVRLLQLLTQCKETKLLLAGKLDDASAEEVIFNISALRVVINSLEHFASFDSDLSDFILCSMIAWLQTAGDSSLDRLVDLHFVRHAAALFNSLANHFDSLIQLTDSDEDVVSDSRNLSEWQDFFLKGASTLLLILLNRLRTENPNHVQQLVINELAHSLRFVAKEEIAELVLNEQLLSPDLDTIGYSEQLQTHLLTFLPLMQRGSFGQQIAAFQIVSKQLEDFLPIERAMYAKQPADDGSLINQQRKDTTERELPKYLIDSLNSSYSLIESVFTSSEFWDFTEAPVPQQTALLAYLLSFKLIIEFLRLTNIEERSLYNSSLLKDRQFDCFMLTLFCILPEDPKMLLNVVEKVNNNPEHDKYNLKILSQNGAALKSLGRSNTTDLKKLFTEEPWWPSNAVKLSPIYVESLACNLLYETLTTFPALVRQWWNNQSKRISLIVEKFVSEHVTGILCGEEFGSISNADRKEFHNLRIVVRPSVREVLATYVTEDMSMELVMRLPPNHPLGPVHVDSGKRVGVPKEQWRKWMLQLNVVLMHQNGSLLDGLQLWKSNVDKHLEGVEDCMICMMAVHGTNYSLPKILCKQCKKKFHAACLYKWFNSSENTTCPMCRTQF